MIEIIGDYYITFNLKMRVCSDEILDIIIILDRTFINNRNVYEILI